MLMFRVMLILGLAAINSYPAASIPLATDQRVIDFFAAVDATDIKTLDAIITANPYMVNATDVHGNTAMNKAQKAGNTKLIAYLIRKGARGPITIVKHKKTLEQHLAATPQVLTYTKGPITAYAFNPEDPWIKNLMIQEEFSYQSRPNKNRLIQKVHINANGNRALTIHQGWGAGPYIFTVFTRKGNGEWNESTEPYFEFNRASVNYSGGHVTANDTLNRIAVLLEQYIQILDYNAFTDRWNETLVARPDNASRFITYFMQMDTTGNLIVVDTIKEIAFYMFHNKAWNPNSIKKQKEYQVLDMSSDGNYILAKSHTGLLILECSYRGEKVTCKELQEIPIDGLLEAGININKNYLVILSEKKDLSRECIMYKQNKNVWEIFDTIDLKFLPTGEIARVIINDDGNCIALEGKVFKSFLLYRSSNKWHRIEIRNYMINASLNRMAYADYVDHTTYIYSMILPELLKLSANQLNFIHDLYEQDQMIKKSKNPHAWIILSPEDVKLFKTMSKDIQIALSRVYKITKQEFLAAAQRKLKEKREGLREFTLPTQSSGPRRGETSADQKTAAQSVTTSTAVKK